MGFFLNMMLLTVSTALLCVFTLVDSSLDLWLVLYSTLSLKHRKTSLLATSVNFSKLVRLTG